MTTQQLNCIECRHGEAFNKDPNFELLQKASTIGIGCLVEVPNDSLTARYQNVRRGEERSEQLLLTSGKPQWSVIGLLLLSYVYQQSTR